MTSVQAGEVEAVHAVTTGHVWEQQGVDVEGQTDIVTMGLPYICPYNVNSIMNPILVMCLSLGYFFNLYQGKPLVREGGVMIFTHPTSWEFHPGHHPSYIDFFEEVLSQTTDPVEMSKTYEESFATDPWYIHLYRTGHAYHGVHPFYMWYWCAHALEHLGRVIVLGGDPKAVRRMGFSPGHRPSTTPSRWRATWSAPPPPSPTSTPHPSCWPTSTDVLWSDRRCSPASAASGSPRPARPGPVAWTDRRPSARSASTTTTSGRGATRCAWPRRSCSTTSPGPFGPGASPRPPSPVSST